MKSSFLFILIAGICYFGAACTSNPQPASGNGTPADSSKTIVKTDTVVVFVGINNKGVGRFKDIQLSHPLDQNMVGKGKAIYGSKCFACHKLTTEMLVGPGWAGVTNRRTPEWIMNWITNTKIMLDKDLAAQSEMVVCLIRMPNQDLTDEQARDVLEFMRNIDGKK